jgi:uncharacterized membrane-anchored protein
MKWARPSTLVVAAVAAAVLQSAVLLLMIERRADLLRHGRSIMLLTQPVDPRDPMRGDYARLRFEISRIAAGSVMGTAPPPGKAAAIYVTTTAGPDGRWHLARASWQPLARLGNGEVMIVGQTRSPFDPRGELAVEYGIERYYVPEGTGRALEQAERAGRLDALVAVAADGRAQLQGLEQNGSPVFGTPLR